MAKLKATNIAGSLDVNNGGVSVYNGGGTSILYPNGARYRSSSNTVTGAIKVKLPVLKTNTMMSFYVDIYNYTENSGATYFISGYNSSSNGWTRCSAFCMSSASSAIRNKTVRFGQDSEKDCVYIGEITDTWNYPSITVRDVNINYQNTEVATWSTGWTIGISNVALVSTQTTITNTQMTLMSSSDAAKHGNHVPATQAADNKKFLRNDNTWQIVTPENIGAATSGHTHTGSIVSMKTLSTENLNSITTTGFYSQNLNANTSAERNYPENQAGCLMVTAGAGTQQRYHVYNTSKIYTRAIYGTTWSSWAMEYNTENKPTASDVGAATSSHGHNNATTSASGFMSNTDKSKLDGIATNANNYIHPNDANTRHVTETEKNTWNSKADGAHTHAYVPTSDVATTATANKVVKLDGNADVSCRLVRSNYANQDSISGALAFRVNNSSDNYIRFCSSTSAIRTWLGVLGNSGGQTLNTGGGTNGNGLILKGTNATGRLWTGSGGFVLQSDGTANLHLGQNNTSDMVFYSDKITVKKPMVLESGATIGGFTVQNASTNATDVRNTIPVIKSDGVMEIGSQIDFHIEGSTRDYDMRFETSKALGTKCMSLHPAVNSGQCYLKINRGDAQSYGYVGNDKDNTDHMYVGSTLGDVYLNPGNNWTQNNGHIIPAADNAFWLGMTGPRTARWKGVNCEGGQIGASDAKFKENIIRLDGARARLTSRNIMQEEGRVSGYDKAIGIDYYNFFKDRFIPTYYNYKLSKSSEGSVADGIGKTISAEEEMKMLKNIGFIAQDYDLENDLVAKEFIFKDGKGELNYNHMSYVTAGMVALQEAIRELEVVKEEKAVLENRLKAIEKKLGL